MWHDWNSTLFGIAAASSLRIVVVATAVAIVLAAVRVRSGGVRHAAWTVVLAAMLLMPVLPRVVPAIEIPLAWPGAIDIARGIALINVPPSSGPGVAQRSADPAPPVTGAALARGSSGTDTAGHVMASQAAVSRSSAGEFWPLMAAAVYLSGFLFLLARLLVGWILMRRVVRASLTIAGDLGAMGVSIGESTRIAAPLTAGVFRPHILLPSTWRTWPEEQLHAVLAHEVAHVRRRDPLIAAVAYLNRAVFWFNPLGWWLERTLATSAEDACDDAALRTATTPRRYAELLLDLAESVRNRRGRVAWQGVGVDGTGLLGQRINRILCGECLGEVSIMRKFSVGLGCATAIILVVACRQQPPQPRPLEPDPQVAERIADNIAATVFDSTARRLTAPQVAELETSLQKNPEDAEARRTLQIFYQYGGRTTIGWNETVAARRPHILWFIEHHPGDEALLTWRTISPPHDPAGYAQARELWLAHTSKKDTPLDVLSNAAYFFQTADRPLAEQFLQRLEATDPGGPTPRMKNNVYHAAWTWRLGELYATALLGLSEEGFGYHDSTSSDVQYSPDVARSPFAVEARRRLETTSDTGILRGAAGRLGWSSLPNAAAVHAGLDAQATAASYFERVLQLEPGNEVVRSDLEALRARQRSFAFWPRFRGVPRYTWPAIVSALPDVERIERLPFFVDSAYMDAEYQETKKHDPAAAKAARDQTRKYVDDLLALCNKLPNDPHRSEGIFSAHIALAGLALQDNDAAAAVRQLDEAVKVPPSEKLKDAALWERVAVGLLKLGERESVARFLDRYSALTEPYLRERLPKAAAAIRAGRMPAFYQNEVTPRPWDR